MSLTTLTVLRRHGSPPTPHIGPTCHVPAQELPDTPPTSDEGWPDDLDWTNPMKPGARIEEIDPVGFVEPSAWERAYLGWLSATLEAPLRAGWDDAEAALGSNHAQLRDTLAATSPWASPEDMPDGVVVRRAATTRGEAIAAARSIRARIRGALGTPAAAAACEGVLVLLPSGGEVVTEWAEVLRRYDLPVRGAVPTPLADAAVAKWVCGLAGLAGWGPHRRRSRDVLAATFAARFWSAKEVAKGAGADADASGGLRRLLRERLDSLRGPSCDLTGWLERLEEPTEWHPDAKLQLAKGMAVGLADALAEGPGLIARLSQLLFGQAGGGGLYLALPSAVRNLDDDCAAAVERIRGILGQLALEERQDGGTHGEMSLRGGDPGPGLRSLLAGRLAGAALVEHARPEAGVTLLPYEMYDGRRSDLLFAAGLGEGGFPVAPPMPMESQRPWLALVGDGADPEAWIEQAVERQLRLAAVAFGRCDGPVELSYAVQGDGDQPTYPGPLLSLLAGGWDDEAWATELAHVQDRSRGDEMTRSVNDAMAWAEVAPLGRGLSLPDPAATEGPLRVGLEGLQARNVGLGSTDDAHRQRHPAAAPGTARVGAYTGRLPGTTATGKAFSPTALETYGRCPAQYFFRKILGVEDEGIDDAEPNPMETGNLIHAALAEATWQARQAAGGLWDLGLDETLDEAGKARRRQEVVAEATVHLWGALQAHAARTGISPPLMRRIGDRWQAVLTNWVHANLKPVPPADTADVDASSTVAPKLSALTKARADEPQINTLAAACEAGSCTSGAAAKALMDGGKIPKGAVGEAFKQWKAADNDADKDAVWDALRQQARDHVARAEADLDAARTAERRRRSDAFHPHVAYAELAFGMDTLRDGADPDSVLGRFELPVPGGAVRVHGEADRVDLDPLRKGFAVRDYKTGKSKLSDKSLKRDLREGHQLQLTLYTLAIEELAKAGRLPRIGDAAPRSGFLEYPRKANPTAKKGGRGSTELVLSEDTGLTLDGRPATWTEISQAWLKHHADGIDTGRFDLLPSHCPKERNDAHCDFERVCGYEPTSRPAFQPDDAAPDLAEVEEDAGDEGDDGKRFVRPQFLRLDAGATGADASAARARHAEAVETIADVERDVVVSAGAGTGKTYNLVRRYLEALAAGASPQQILCVTFTRKAAAEMSHRIRAALLAEPDEDLRKAVGDLRDNPARFRRTLLTLSAAPISTIDSLALRIVDEHERGDGEPGVEGRQVVSSSAVADTTAQLVTEAFLQALDDDDPDLRHLLDHIGPSALRKKLTDAVKRWDGQLDTLNAEDTLTLWWSLAEPAAAAAQAGVDGLDLQEWRRLFDDALAQTAKGRRPNDEGERRAAEALSAAADLRDGTARTGERRWRLLAKVLSCPTSKGGKHQIGDNDLRAWLVANVAPLAKAAGDVWPPIKKALGEEADFAGWAEVSVRAQRLAGRWADALSLRLRDQGRWRFADVEREALRILGDEASATKVRKRMPLKHVFVDESQDTNGTQVRLIERLVEVTGARRFWVGDVKQSIYRFRGAEVDVFEDRLSDPRGAEIVGLTLNRRSRRPLIQSVNRLFGALLPARSGGVAVDPGSEIDFDALGWHAGRDQDEDTPRIQLLATMGKRWHAGGDAPPDEADGGDADEASKADEVVGEHTDAELALVQAIRVRLEDKRRDPRLPDVAILVHSWNRAKRYRDLLALHGETAVVQGGGGLLSTPEVDHLVQWLEAVALHSDVSLLGALRGPGCALSDAGLYCLRRGFGVTDEAGVAQDKGCGLRWASRWGRLDADQALTRWTDDDASLDADAARPTLEADAEGLRRFQGWLEALEDSVAAGRAAEGLRRLADDAGLWAWWGGRRPDERQRVANLQTFLDLVAQLQRDAPSPAALVSRLGAMRDGDDPASGGLDAGGEARVVITTLWQAKGREWPIVALPDLERWKASGRDSAGFHGWRLRVPEGDERVAKRVPGALRTTAAEPLESQATPWVKELAGHWNRTAERAELRRLLYVGMTRAKEEVLLTGRFDSPNPDNAVPHPSDPDADKVFTLAHANDWAKTLLAATGLSFEPDGTPTLGAGAWTAADIHLARADEVAAELVPPTAPKDPDPEAVTLQLAQGWAPVDSPAIPRVLPSSLSVDLAPDADGRLGLWPVKRPTHERALPAAMEGTVLHGVLEAWGYQASLPDVSLIEAQIGLHAPGAPGDHAAIAAELKTWIDQALTTRQDLTDRLVEAAAAGALFHEVPVSFHTPDGLVEGNIDLLYRDAQGWHILDYKWGVTELPTAGERDILNKHYAQVRCYAAGFAAGMPGEPLADFGLWYPATGLVLTWRPDGAQT